MDLPCAATLWYSQCPGIFSYLGLHDSQDTNPLYDKPYEAQLLFGRGFRAGVDSREQIQKQVHIHPPGLFVPCKALPQ